MKRFTVIALIFILILTFATPVCALNDQPKFDREINYYAEAEWTIGEPYGTEPYETIELQLYRYKGGGDEFALQLIDTDFDGSVYTILSYYVNIPENEFTFPRDLDSGIALDVQTQGTQYGYSYEIDENYMQINEQWWDEPAAYDFNLVWTRDNHVRESVNNHFALNFTDDPAELTDLVYKSKDERITGLVSGTINQRELSDGAGSYGISTEKIPYVYFKESLSDIAAAQITAKREQSYRYNEFIDFSDLGGYWLMPIGDDPEVCKSIYLSIGMYDKRSKTWSLNISEDILNDSNEVVGWSLFIAEIPDSAFAFPKDSPGTVALDIHVTGTRYDYYKGEDEGSEPEPIITESVEHDILAIWDLATTQTGKGIVKYSDDYSKSIEKQIIAYYNGTAILTLDGESWGEGSGWGTLWLDHMIGKQELN